jgi:hypothetical protein
MQPQVSAVEISPAALRYLPQLNHRGLAGRFNDIPVLAPNTRSDAWVSASTATRVAVGTKARFTLYLWVRPPQAAHRRRRQRLGRISGFRVRDL